MNQQLYHSTGQQLGNYRLLQLLGHGNFSEVYLGQHVFQQTTVVIKVLQERRTEGERARFLTQAASLTHLHHPHIVHILDFGIFDGTACLVMEYIPNGHLRQRHPKGTRVPLKTVVTYVKQIASGLQYVHQQNLVHRDIKPHNMLIGANDEIMLSDFGIAVISPSLIPGGVYDFEGTAPYAAPEQLQGKPRRGSDQYALGVVVYEWLSGSWPFSGSFDKVVHQHLFVPPPSFQERGIALPPAVEQVVMRALAKEPEQRFPNVETFANALEQASQPEIKHTPVPEVKPSPQPRRQFMSPHHLL